MKITLANNQELSPYLVTGGFRYVNGFNRDALSFIFPESEGMEALDSAFTAENCENITIEDSYALQMPDLFRSWDDALSSGSALAANTIINKDGALYRVVQSVTPLESQPPDMDGMLAIYRPIEPSHAGTQEDPIPWAYGMDCTAGSYYSYGGVTYRCAGDMVPCVWAPGTSGVWQWEET